MDSQSHLINKLTGRKANDNDEGDKEKDLGPPVEVKHELPPPQPPTPTKRKPPLVAKVRKREVPVDLSSIKNCSLKNITIRTTDNNEEEQTLVFSNFRNMAELFDDVTDDGELKKRVIKAGIAETPPIGCRVWIHYESYIEECNEPFDDKYKSKEKFSFILFDTNVIPVLEYGVASMELKERAHFLTTARYAYGALGIPDLVPQNCAMIFMIELVDFIEFDNTLPIYRQLTKAEKDEKEFIELKNVVDEIKSKANERWRKGKYRMARHGYYRAMIILQRPKNLNKNLDAERNELLFAVYNNMAICNLQLNEYETARSYCEKALELPPDTVGNRCKLYYRLAKAEFELGHFMESKKHCDTCLKLQPANKECRNLYDAVCERIYSDSKATCDLYKKMAAKLTRSESEEKEEEKKEEKKELKEEEEEKRCPIVFINGVGYVESPVESDSFDENDGFEYFAEWTPTPGFKYRPVRPDEIPIGGAWRSSVQVEDGQFADAEEPEQGANNDNGEKEEHRNHIFSSNEKLFSDSDEDIAQANADCGT